jgi:hypothetical protein
MIHSSQQLRIITHPTPCDKEGGEISFSLAQNVKTPKSPKKQKSGRSHFLV